LHAVDVQIIPFEVSAGDHILLISDGICDAEEGEQEADWLSDYLSGDYPEDDNALIGTLFSKARAHGSDDDMSVISIRIFNET
jgi:serine/threonine protein phosphatase PrpC